MDVAGLRKELGEAGQGHLMHFYDELTDEEKIEFYRDLRSIPINKMKSTFETAMDSFAALDGKKVDDMMSAPPQEVCGDAEKDGDKLDDYWQIGLDAISGGKVAVLLLAGGQGTRLGVSYPKGMYNVGLPSGKSLFQLQAERILKLQALAGERSQKQPTIPWYIMASDSTYSATQKYFESREHFGLRADQVVMFRQGTLPCFDFQGRILLAAKGKVARAPDGNGGLYRALLENDMVSDMERRGVTALHVYCVDNILVKVADPVFLGFCMDKGADCAVKVVKKTEPTEPVGVVCKVGGAYRVVEYSEIGTQTAERRREEDGELVFNAGNICNHYFTTDFLRKVCFQKESSLEHHVAKKKIPFVSPEGRLDIPTAPNGVKLEKFVFDVFQFATNFAVWQSPRAAEFSPLKNAATATKDTPATCRQMTFDLHCDWVQRAGGTFLEADCACEISPLLSYAGEGCQLKSLVSGRQFSESVYLASELDVAPPGNPTAGDFNLLRPAPEVEEEAILKNGRRE